jgi:hypothetical protein
MKIRSFQFGLRTLLLAPALVAIVLTANRYEIIDWHYDRIMENDPLLAPVRVRTVSESQLELEDGRCFVLMHGSFPRDSLRRFISQSQDTVEVQQKSDDFDVFDVYVAYRRDFAGGTSPGRTFANFPLIARDVERYGRLQCAYVRPAECQTSTGD